MRRSFSLLLVAGLAGCATSPPPPIQPDGKYRPINASNQGAKPMDPVARPMTAEQRLAADIAAMLELQDRIRRDSVTAAAERRSQGLDASPADLVAADKLQGRVDGEDASPISTPSLSIVAVPVPTVPLSMVPVAMVASELPNTPPATGGPVAGVADYQDAPIGFAPPVPGPHPTRAASSVSESASESLKTETVYVYPDVFRATGKPVKLPASTEVIVVPDSTLR